MLLIYGFFTTAGGLFATVLEVGDFACGGVDVDSRFRFGAHDAPDIWLRHYPTDVDQSEAKVTRSALSVSLIEQELARLGGLSVLLEVRDSVGSTNNEVLSYLSALTTHGVVVVTADEQTAGRGRLDRSWSSPWAAGIALTLGVPASRIVGEITSTPLRAGLAVQRALATLGVDVLVKWPNDIVTAQGNKLGGLLSSLHDQNVVVGIGLNVSLDESELPTATATSLTLLGHEVSREKLIAHIVHEFHNVITQSEWLDNYLTVSATVGQQVILHRQGLTDVHGTAVAFAHDGSILIENEQGTQTFSIGDVEHLRAADSN